MGIKIFLSKWTVDFSIPQKTPYPLVRRHSTGSGDQFNTYTALLSSRSTGAIRETGDIGALYGSSNTIRFRDSRSSDSSHISNGAVLKKEESQMGLSE
ncbi:hypothetical protein K7X08_034141 [Anisodus acutangulus]|uniref:Uncharacterized protein n=1 Tax=Anisodus acutangulus TaxID=402998 RepID=A0A9Q1RAK3_9SOLA|nr:hypothetical protein K7X08_034141 [Anisodus acutangulus]